MIRYILYNHIARLTVHEPLALEMVVPGGPAHMDPPGYLPLLWRIAGTAASAGGGAIISAV